MTGILHLDLFYQEKYLLNHVDLKIKLRRSRDAFALMADADNYKIIIKDLALFVRNVQLSPAVRMCHVTTIPHPTCRSQSRYGSPWQHELRPGQHVFGTVAEKTGDWLHGQ